MSVVEVYNESVIDLLASPSDEGENMAVCTVLNNPQVQKAYAYI